MDKNTIFDKLQALSVISTELDGYAEPLNATIDTLNAMLTSIRLGVTAWVANTIEPVVKLGYSKIDNKWGLGIRCDNQLWQFNSSPRGFRLIAIALLPDLLDALLINANIMLHDVQEATATVTVINEAIGKIRNEV